jgi:hypothetical protein
MKTNWAVRVIGALILAFGAVENASATCDTNKLSMALSFVGQGPEVAKTNSNGSVTYVQTVDQFRISDKDLLSVIAEAKSITIPTGSFLEVNGDIFNGGVTVIVKSKTTGLIADVSDLFPVFIVTSDDFWAGKYNDTTYAEAGKDYYTVHIKFDDQHGKTFDVTGFATESFNLTAMNANGFQTCTDSVSIVVTGNGADEFGNLIVKGTITLKGKTVED